MEFPFPPPPDGYTSVIVFRWMLVAWLIVQLGVLCWRIHQWKRMRTNEVGWWLIGGAIGAYLLMGGICGNREYDNNTLVEVLGLGVISVVVAGLVTVMTKMKMDEKLKPWDYYASVAVLGVIAMLLIEIGKSSWSSGRRTTCRNNLKQIGLAIHNYHDDFNIFPAAVSGKPGVSWRVSILPYLDQAALFKRYDQQKKWDSPPNDGLALERLDELRCPSNYNPKDSQGRWFTAYSMPTGLHSVGASPKGTRIRDITDGTSNTLLVVEACGAQIVWTEPRDVDVASQPTGINLKGTKPGQSAGWLSSYHSGGTQVLLADGSVRFVSAKIDPTVLKNMATVDGGEVVKND